MSFSLDAWRTPEEAGVSSLGLADFLSAWEEKRNQVQFHSLIVLRHGKTVCRMNFAPYDDQTPHTLFSPSKSFTSAAAGFAVAEGKIAWDSRVADLLPEEVPQGRREELLPITLENLLCMGSGLEEESDSLPSDPGVTWARHVLSHRLAYPPMTHFHYNTLGTYLVSCMLQKATGQTVRDYLTPRLFAPLGIETPAWDLSPQGVCCGGFGLHLKADDIARFGQCLLDHGLWQGKRVLPEGWVELATREHIANYEGRPQDGNEWGQGYGFQFWRCMDGRYRGDGMFGQVCMIDEKRDAVVAATCAAADMGEEFRLIREHLFPAFDAPAATEAQQQALRDRIGALCYPFPADDGSGRPLPEGEYQAELQEKPVRVALRMGPQEQLCLILRGMGEPEAVLPLSRGKAGLCAVIPMNGVQMRYLGAYGWRQGALHIAIRCPDGPDTADGVLTWSGDQLIFDGFGAVFPQGRTVFRRVTKETE